MKLDKSQKNNKVLKLRKESINIQKELIKNKETPVQLDFEQFSIKITNLIKNKELEPEMIVWLNTLINQNIERDNEYKSIINNQDNIPIEQAIAESKYFKSGVLDPKETTPTYEDIFRSAQLYKILNEDAQDSNKFPTSFFKSIGSDEFGISRLMSDPLNNLPKILDKFIGPKRINEETDVYITQAEYQNSTSDKIRIEYRHRAPSPDAARKQAEAFVKRINGKQKKVFEACWYLANNRHQRMVSCELTDIMSLAYPGREKESFSVKERIDFFQDLLDLSSTQIIVEKYTEKNQEKSSEPKSFILPFVTILQTSSYNMVSEKKSNQYPNNLTYSVLHNQMYENEKMYNLGAAIKKRTLELSHDDMQLAEYIQIRRSQIMKETQKFITFTDRIELMKLANLDGIKHSGMANKKLLEKFKRIQDKGIILDFPQKVIFPFHVKIR